MWYWVSLSYATYAVKIENGRVADTAPIASWMIGKDSKYVHDWLKRKGAVIRRL